MGQSCRPGRKGRGAEGRGQSAAGRGRGRQPARPLPAPPPPLSAQPALRPPVTSLARAAGAILKVESPVPAAAAAVAVVAAAAAAAAVAAAAGQGARAGKPQSETHHPAGWSACPSFLAPRPPPPPPTGAIRRHPPSLPPHPQVRGVSSGSGDPEEPSRVTICSATWQVREKWPSPTAKAPLPCSSLHHPLATACASPGAAGAPRISGTWSGGVGWGWGGPGRWEVEMALKSGAGTLAWAWVGVGWGGAGGGVQICPHC
jgi:hypothetical protein